MLENLGIVQLEACDAPREDLERAMALARRRLGGVTLLEWIARRVTDAELLDRTVVLLPGDENGPAASLASLVPPDVPVCFATGTTRLARIAQVLVTHPARGVVTVGVTSPMVDPDHLDRLIISSRENPTADFIGFQASDRTSSDFPGWCRTEALMRLAGATTQESKSFEPTAADVAKIRQHWLPLTAREEKHPAPQIPANDDGWEHAETIFEHLGHECFDGQWVADRPQAVPRPAGRHTRRREEVLEAK